MALPSPAPLSPPTDPNPKPGPATTTPNSGSSSSTAATPLPDKRTRDQPNLSDCHCCFTRINHTKPNDRLQPLPSVWRIVLLCRKCRDKVSSGQTCSYCFKQTGDSGDIVECSVCESRIHVDCVKEYGSFTPWCYLVGLGEFSVCVDCWVPDLLKSSVRRCVRSVGKGVDGDDGGDAECGLGKLVKNRKFVVEKKFKGGQELRKIMAAKKGCDGRIGESSNSSNAIGIMDDAELAVRFRSVFSIFPSILRSEFALEPVDLNVWKIRNWGGISYKRFRLGRECGKGQKMHSSSLENDIRAGENGSRSDDNEVKLGLATYKRDKKRKIWKIDDANLMVFESRSIQPEEKFELHSSDARTSCSTDVSDALLCVDAYKSGSPIDVDRYISKALIRVNADQTSSCIGVDRFGEKLAIYKRSRFRRKGQVNGMVYVCGECRFCDNRECTCKTEYRQPDDEKDMTYFIVECQANVILPSGGCNTEQDRYHLKYLKRVATTKPYLSRLHSSIVGCKNKSPESALSNSETDSSFKCDDELRLPNESGDARLNRYSFKYVKRVKGSKSGSNAEIKLRPDSIQPQSEASATGLIIHHTEEYRTMSNFI